MNHSNFTGITSQIPKLFAISAITLFTQQCVAESIECRIQSAWKKNETDVLRCVEINEKGLIQDHLIKKSGRHKIGSCTLEIVNNQVISITCKRGKSGFFPNLDLG